VHVGHVVVFALTGGRILARVSTLDQEAQVRNGIAFARYAAARGHPVLEPVLGPPGFVTAPTGLVTLWPRMSTLDSDPDWAWLGGALRRLHEDMAPPLGRSVRTSASALEARQERFARRCGDPSLVRRVEAAVAELNRYAAVLDALPERLIHGDPYKVNIVRGDDGYRLIDYDSAGRGPVLFDLVTVYLYRKRFGLTGAEVDRFVDAYGCDPTAQPHFAEVLRMRELGLVTYLLDLAAGDRRYRTELAYRLATLDRPARWQDLSRFPTAAPAAMTVA
jgi:Ser/Thr protein kinase RdoA (MazF antagonist)